MPELEIAIPRPQRWDEPFGEMTAQDVDVLLRVEPFRSIDAGAFPPALPLRGILQGDTRVMRYDTGDLIVREGDYGHSAFLVLAGSVRVVLERLNPAFLGRDLPERRGWWQAVAQLWQNSRLPEVRRAVGPAGQFAAAIVYDVMGAGRRLHTSRTSTGNATEAVAEWLANQNVVSRENKAQ